MNVQFSTSYVRFTPQLAVLAFVTMTSSYAAKFTNKCCQRAMHQKGFSLTYITICQ